MIKYAWNGYKKYAWGANEVRPILKQAHNQDIFGGSKSDRNMAATIIDAIDTLWIMNLTKEYYEVKFYLAKIFVDL